MSSALTTREFIASRIYFLRGEKVLMDYDLATLYKVNTKQLKRQVRRNIVRFPDDFMFKLNAKELANLRSQIGTSRISWGGTRYLPLAFTEHGIAMLSSVLGSKSAIQVNIAIVRTFVALRRWMASNKELAEKIKHLEDKYDEQFKVVFDAIQRLIRQ